MRIYIDKTLLADLGEIESMRINGSRMLQASGGTRWEQVKIRDRKNRKTVITVTVNRLHDSIAEAQRFLLTHEGTIPATGLITLACGVGDGDASLIYLVDAGIEVVDRTYWGASTVHNYTFIGGQFSTKKT